MTKNKPEIVGYVPTKNGKLVGEDLSLEDFTEQLRENPAGLSVVPLIRLGDYEILEADRNQQYDMKVKAREQRDKVVAELKTLQAKCRMLESELATVKKVAYGNAELLDECEELRKVADQYRKLIEMGEDFHWENIIRVDISDFPSRADAIDAVMRESRG